MNRYILCLGLPFALCVFAPSVVGSILVQSMPGYDEMIFTVVGAFLVIVFPVTILALFILSRPKQKTLTA